MYKRKATSSEKSSSKKRIKEDLLTWIANHRALDTFMKEHLNNLDLAVLAMTCKTLNQEIRDKTEKLEKYRGPIPKVSCLNAAIRFGHYKLACWFKDRGCKFEYSTDAESAYIFRPYSKQIEHQKRLVKELVLDNKDSSNDYFAHISYWGNRELMSPMFRHSDTNERHIVKNAARGGHIFILSKIVKYKHWHMDGVYDAAATAGRFGVLDWLVSTNILPNPWDLHTLCSIVFFGSQSIFFKAKKIPAKTVEEIKKWVTRNPTIEALLQREKRKYIADPTLSMAID